MNDQQDIGNIRAKTAREPQRQIDDIIMERIRCTSGHGKQMFFAQPEPSESKSALKQLEKQKLPQQPTPEVLMFAESAILEKFARILDSKLAPANLMLDNMEKKISDLESMPLDRLGKSVAPNPSLLTSVEQRFNKFFEETMAQTRMAIGEGVNYYNQSLATRETDYKQEHDTITQTFMQASRTIIDSRVKLNITNHDRIMKAIMKLKDALQQNSEGLETVSCELDKVTIYLEKYLEQRQKQKVQQDYNDEIDPQDLIELDEQEIIKILMERMNIPNLPELSYSSPSPSFYPSRITSQYKPPEPEPRVQDTRAKKSSK